MLDDPPPKFGMVQVYNHKMRSEVKTPIISVLKVVIQPLFDCLIYIFVSSQQILSSISIAYYIIFKSISNLFQAFHALQRRRKKQLTLLLRKAEMRLAFLYIIVVML